MKVKPSVTVLFLALLCGCSPDAMELSQRLENERSQLSRLDQEMADLYSDRDAEIKKLTTAKIGQKQVAPESEHASIDSTYSELIQKAQDRFNRNRQTLDERMESIRASIEDLENQQTE